MGETDRLLLDAASTLDDIVPGMLKKKVAAFVFLPWLCSYTQRVREAAKQEERQQILAALPDLSEEVRNVILARESRCRAG